MKAIPRFIGLAVITITSISIIGCQTTIPPREFIAKYTTDIEVPDPNRSQLPCRIYLGKKGKYYLIKDVIPYGQGGGFLGKTIIWRCPASELPADFPEAYRPGETILDGRIGSKYKYMIQAYYANKAYKSKTPSLKPVPTTKPSK